MSARYFLLAALVLLCSCATTPRLNIDPSTQKLAAQGLNSFRVTGGLGVWTDDESISTRVVWQQIADDFDILIRLPAGLSSVRVTQINGQATVRNGSAAPVAGQSASRLLQQALGLGVAVPIEQMSLWIKGVPGEQAEKVTYDKQGRLASMEYVDTQNTRWRAKVLKYTTFENTYVPATVLATGGPYNVRLVLKQWSSKLDDLVAKNEGASTTGRLQVPGR